MSDLLAQVPGVYLWRGGFTGRPEPVNYRGRGASSTEYYLDGVLYLPFGVDSVAVDPALFSISLLDRIEVEPWPDVLRVYLFTRRHDLRAPRSRLAIARGDGDYARYEGSLERRFDTGVGFALAADYLSSPTASGASSTYSNTQVWAQGSYVPKPTVGLQYQLIRSGPNRRPFVVSDPIPNDTIGAGFDATRTDMQVRLALRKRETGDGPYWTCYGAAATGTARGWSTKSDRRAATSGYAVPPRTWVRRRSTVPGGQRSMRAPRRG